MMKQKYIASWAVVPLAVALLAMWWALAAPVAAQISSAQPSSEPSNTTQTAPPTSAPSATPIPTPPIPATPAPQTAPPTSSPTASQSWPATQPLVAASELERLLAARPVVNGTLTLDQAVATALRESPVVRGAAEEVEAALGRLNMARAERRPLLSANTFLTGGTLGNIVESPQIAMSSALMSVPRGPFFDQNLTLMAPLYTGSRLRTLVRQAATLRDASQAELEGQRQEVALLTRTAYREVQARRALVEVQRARLRENEEQLRLDRIRAEEGKIPPFFVLRQEAEVAATQQELTNAAHDVELSLLQLKTVMGISPASAIEVPGVLEYQPSADVIARLGGTTALMAPSSSVLTAPGASTSAIPAISTPTGVPADLGALLRVAERRRPELRAATLRITGAELETAAMGQAYRPQVNAFVMGDVMKMRGESVSGGTTFGVAASIPIFTGGRRGAAIQTAQAERRRLERERERIALEVAQGVNAAYLNLRAAEQNITTAQVALRSAQEDYRVARIRYEAGKSIIVEVLDALAARVRAESNVVQALYGYNVARDQLLRAVGVVNAEGQK
jgi:outer membrane protein